MTHTYHLKNPHYRESVDLRAHKKDLEKAMNKFPVSLLEVTKSCYTIKIDADSKKTKNQIVRALGHVIALTSLKVYVTHKAKKNELFIEKKPKKKK